MFQTPNHQLDMYDFPVEEIWKKWVYNFLDMFEQTFSYRGIHRQ